MEKLVDLSEQLTRLAEQSNWPEVNRLSLQREQRLEQFFSNEISTDIRETVIDAISRIRFFDEETVRLVKKNREALGEGIIDLLAHKRRIKNYISNQH
ncbi:MAG: flagellar protein FliT [Pseudomonadales bacterium]|nr:flagellar protein FliT [Pseudomonadales bacterium]